MNKLYFILAFVALCGVALAYPTGPSSSEQALDLQDDPYPGEQALDLQDDPYPGEQWSEVAMIPTDEEEIAELKKAGGQRMVFSDFCLSARDLFYQHMASSANHAAAVVFKTMFNNATDLQETAIKVQRKSIEDGVKKIQESHVLDQLEGTNLTGLETPEEIAEDYKERVVALKSKKETLLQKVGNAVKGVIDTVFETLASEMAQKVAMLRAHLSPSNAGYLVSLACMDISTKLKTKMNQVLVSAKIELLQSSDNSEDLKDLISSTNLENVGCITTKRVMSIDRFCMVWNTAGPLVWKILGVQA